MSQISNLEELLKVIFEKMLEHEQKGRYVDAEGCRVQLQHRKEQLRNHQLYQIESRHKSQRNQLNSHFNDQVKHLNDFWHAKMTQFANQSQQNLKDLSNKHNQQQDKHQQEMQAQLSTKVKESSQLLNLRKMEEQMAKQKSYVQAHRVQQKIKNLFAKEQQVWMQKRQEKINQALTNLKRKQNGEVNNMMQRIKTTQQDNAKDHHFEGLRIRQKYENNLKDLKALQEREALSFKGQFRTLGGTSPPSSPVKSLSKSQTIRT